MSAAKQVRAAAAVVCGALLALGCQAPREQTSFSSADPTLEATWIDLDGLKQRLAAERGRVVVINFWATWCEPCREEFPHLIRFYERHSARGLSLLSVSIDSPRVRDTEVRKFLADQRPPFPVFIKTAGDDDAFINGMDPSWNGALPMTYIYDRQGLRRHALTGPQSLATLEKLVQPLL